MPSRSRSLDLQDGLALVERYGRAERWLAVLVTLRADGTPSVSVVNAGVLRHPADGEPVVGFVSRAGTAKLRNLRHDPNATLVFRSGWEWVAVSGQASIIDDGAAMPVSTRELLRDIYHAAGGHHNDLDAYDRVMAEEGRTAVLVRPERFTTNPPGTDHQEHS